MIRLVILVFLGCVGTVYSTVSQCAPAASTALGLCGGKYCSSEAVSCGNNGKCVCNNGRVGVPGIMCTSPDNHVTSNVNDPRSLNWDGEAADVAVPCQYPYSDVTTRIKHPNSDYSSTGKCRIETFMANERGEGKLYVSNVLVKVTISGLPANQNQVYTFQMDGNYENNAHCFQMKWKKNNGNWVDRYDTSVGLNRRKPSKILNLRPNFEVVPGLNQAVLDIDRCGAKIAFRPAEAHLPIAQQQFLPGVVASYEEILEFNNNDRNIVPSDEMSMEDVTGPTRTGDQALLYRAVKGAAFAPQSQERKSAACDSISDAFDSCADAAEENVAMALCNFIFEKPLFHKCYSNLNNDSGSSQAIDIWKRCIKQKCSQDSAACNQVQSDAQPCHSHMGSLLAGHSCSYSGVPEE